MDYINNSNKVKFHLGLSFMLHKDFSERLDSDIHLIAAELMIRVI